MKRKKKWIAATVLSSLLLISVPSMAMAQDVTVTLPTFPITLNGYELAPRYDEQPVIIYNGVTYVLVSYLGFLNLDTTWADNTMTVKKVRNTSKNIRGYENTEANKNKYTASIATWNVAVNGKTIKCSKEQYPLLEFRDTTYFPLTWRFAANEFGWDYYFNYQSDENGYIQFDTHMPPTVVCYPLLYEFRL